MDLTKLIKDLGPGNVKVAGDQTNVAPTADAAVQNALTGVLDKVAGQAAAPAAVNPVDALLKVAEDLAGSEKQAELLHAEACGRNIANGMMATFAAADAQAKVASLQGAMAPVAPAPAPVATAADAQVLKVASDTGYNDVLVKIAAEEFREGQQAAIDDVRYAAANEFFKGAQVADLLIAQAQAR